jgi:hypothetical protein
MALQKIPALSAIPVDGTSPASVGAAEISNSTAVRILSKCTAAAGSAFLARYEPELGKWWPYAEYAPMLPDSAVNGGKFSGRYAIEKTGTLYLVLVAGAGVTLSPTADDHQIEGVQL